MSGTPPKKKQLASAKHPSGRIALFKEQLPFSFCWIFHLNTHAAIMSYELFSSPLRAPSVYHCCFHLTDIRTWHPCLMRIMIIMTITRPDMNASIVLSATSQNNVMFPDMNFYKCSTINLLLKPVIQKSLLKKHLSTFPMVPPARVRSAAACSQNGISSSCHYWTS